MKMQWWVAAFGLVGCGEDAPAKTDATETDVAVEVSDIEETGEVEVSERSSCDPSHDPVTPIGTNDFSYPIQKQYLCLPTKAAFCEVPAPAMAEELLQCKAAAGGWFSEQGSVAFRVMGRESGDCVIDFLAETEGGASYRRCRLPLPLTPWAGLAVEPGGEILDAPFMGIEADCTILDTCTLLEGGPGTLCYDLDPKPPDCNPNR